MKLALAVVFVIAILKGVDSLSGGAPAGACDTLSPDPTQHGAQPQTGAVPYAVNYTGLDMTNGTTPTFGYLPGQTYTITFAANAANAGMMFRGFLVQTRTVVGDNRVGSFAVLDAGNSRLSSCTPSNIAVTHSNPSNKTSISFNWTAPPEGTGPIRFRFAAVQVQRTYWADQSSATVQEIGPDGMAVTVMVPSTTDGAVKLSSVGLLSVLLAAVVAAMKI